MTRRQGQGLDSSLFGSIQLKDLSCSPFTVVRSLEGFKIASCDLLGRAAFTYRFPKTEPAGLKAHHYP
jgi:hypothetical protein